MSDWARLWAAGRSGPSARGTNTPHLLSTHKVVLVVFRTVLRDSISRPMYHMKGKRSAHGCNISVSGSRLVSRSAWGHGRPVPPNHLLSGSLGPSTFLAEGDGDDIMTIVALDLIFYF